MSHKPPGIHVLAALEAERIADFKHDVTWIADALVESYPLHAAVIAHRIHLGLADRNWRELKGELRPKEPR